MALTQVSTDGVKNDAISHNKIPANAIQASELADNAVDTAAIADAAVTTAKINNGNVTTAKIADDAVNADKLQNTGVNPATYGSSTSIPSITVDAQGRITAASGNSVNTDLVGDTSPQLGGNLDTNGSGIIFKDNNAAFFGTGSDLKVYHDGSNNFIEARGVGDVTTFKTSNSNAADTGALAIRANGDTSRNDGVKALFGNSDDLKIYHSGSHSYIQDSGTGALLVLSNQFAVQNAAGSETIMSMTENGSVDLYYNDAKKFETQSGGAKVTGLLTVDGNINPYSANNNTLGLHGHRWNHVYVDDSVDLSDSGELRLGASDDLKLLHNGTESRIDFSATAHNLKIMGSGGSSYIDLQPRNGHSSVKAIANNAVELYYDNAKKFETLSDGVNVTGTLKVNGSAFSSGIGNVVEDTSPQLGGHLDTNNHNITWSTGEKAIWAPSSGAGPEVFNSGSSNRDLDINIDNEHRFRLHQNGILYQKGANSSNGGAYSSVQPSYPIRAWLSFNDEDNITNGHGGISSVSDTGTGYFTINYSTSFPDDNYVCVAMSGGQSGSRGDDTCITHGATNPGTGSIGIRTRKFTDNSHVNSESAMFLFLR